MTKKSMPGTGQDGAQIVAAVGPGAATTFGAAWLRFRDELDARILARFGLALQARGGDDADPDILADLALERALMP